MHNDIIFSIFLIFCGAAVLATLALFTRQSLLVAYIVLGAILGPWGAKLVSDPVIIKDIGDIGIIFLLFLLGLNLQPQNLIKMLSQTTLITVVSSCIFAGVGFLVGLSTGFSTTDSMVIGICMMFSSTIIGLKLLPTTVMHHQRTGEVVISILLLQDIIAIFAMLLIHGAGTGEGLSTQEVMKVLFALPGLVFFAFMAERFFLVKVFKRFNQIHEYLFLVAIGWCLGIGQLAEFLSLSFEIGAFIAGISIAQSPISRFIADSLRPLRDFFLILFFFSLGAQFDVSVLSEVAIPAMILASLMLIIKPLTLKPLLLKTMSTPASAWEVGVRIGQISEFSLLVAYTASKSQIISEHAYFMIQAATIITFVVSSYWIVNRYPTPIAATEKLRRD
tara:strand:- start:88744 stop:89913 length:1170 start_codon:yes stop_codon:yes gene_type:complete